MEPESINTIWPIIKNICLTITSVITVASLITAGTETPKKYSKLNKFYQFVEKLALVVGKVKEKNE